MIRIWQGQQRKEWERCSMSAASIANTKLQKTLARAFLHAFFFFSFLNFLRRNKGGEYKRGPAASVPLPREKQPVLRCLICVAPSCRVKHEN